MNVVSQVKNVVGQSLNTYHTRVKPTMDRVKFTEEYQGRILDCMIGEVDDNYIETPEMDNPIVKLEYSREGLVKIPSIKGKTILVDPEGNVTDTPGEGCRLVSVGEEEGNKLIILSKNKNLFDGECEYGHIVEGNYYAHASVVRPINKIKVKEDTDYFFSCLGNIIFERVVMFKDDVYVREHIWSTPNLKLTTNGANQVAFVIKNKDNWDKVDINSVKNGVMVEEGASVTSYVSLQQHKSEILLSEPLRSYNGVFDEIIGNKLIRRIGIMKIDSISKIGKAKINSDKL